MNKVVQTTVPHQSFTLFRDQTSLLARILYQTRSQGGVNRDSAPYFLCSPALGCDHICFYYIYETYNKNKNLSP